MPRCCPPIRLLRVSLRVEATAATCPGTIRECSATSGSGTVALSLAKTTKSTVSPSEASEAAPRS
eukprot:scaffold8482_cov592-Pinguiococcus_pyrenoidosus.AAC.1